MYCIKCGEVLDDNAKFCPKCGEKILGHNHNKHEKITESIMADKEHTDEPKKQMKFSKRKLILLIITILCLIVIAIITILFLNSKNNSEPVNTKKAVAEKETPSDEEYIFSNSDAEYLTNTDLEGLSAEELALARNEIIARHGRMFTDEKYKSYFESKSWYEGTISPDKFDANYENELNDIEKTNIELIKTYEQKANKTDNDMSTEVRELAQKYYGNFLQYYKEQEAQGFTQKDLELINPIFFDPLYFPNGYDKELYYTVIDLADDGIPELFISDKKTIYNAYYLLEQDFQVCPLIGEIGKRYLGDGVLLDICDNKIIKETRIKNDLTSATTFYQVEKHTSEFEQMESTSINEGKYFRIFSDGKEAEKITKERYNEIVNHYPLKEDIEWCKLSEFKNKDEVQTSGDYKNAYLELLRTESSSPMGWHYYFLFDIDKNGIPELIIAKSDTGDTIKCYVYSYNPDTKTPYLAGAVPAPLAECYPPRNVPGVALLMRFAGMDAGVILTLENNTLVQSADFSTDESEMQYYRSKQALPRYEITDFSPLEN